MKHIIILTGSARPNSVSQKVAPMVKAALETSGDVSADIVDVASLGLPFFDAPFAPSQDGFAPTDPQVIAWTKRVAEADGVVLLTPEYNAGVSGIQKNAIDWVYKEWADKPVAFIGYGWHDPSRVQASLRIGFEQVLHAALVEPFAQLQFMHDIDPSGAVLDQETVDRKLAATIDSFVGAL